MRCIGASVDELTPLACNDDYGSLQSKITEPVSGGTTYLLQVGGYAGNAGSLTLNFAPIHKDKFAERGVHQLKGVPGEWRLYQVSD